MIKRLHKDIKELHNNPIDQLYYHIDENDITNIMFMIIGPPNTPYEYGYFIFKAKISKKYPFKPPEVKFLSTDGYIRFHPFLYETGKICLSLLNTWAGPQWTSIQTLRSILLSIQSIFTDKAFLDEPGHENDSPYMVNTYNKIIEYYKYKFAIHYQLNNKIFPIFYDIQKDLFLKNYDFIQNKITNLIQTLPTNLSKLCITHGTTIIIKYSDDKITWYTYTIHIHKDTVSTDLNIINQLISFEYETINNVHNITLNEKFIEKTYIKIVDYNICAPYPFSKMNSRFDYNNISKKLKYLKEKL